MTIAYCLINVALGSEESCLKAVQKIPGVVEAFGLYGLYDILTKIEGTMEGIKKIVTDKIRVLDGIESTLTMVVMRE